MAPKIKIREQQVMSLIKKSPLIEHILKLKQVSNKKTETILNILLRFLEPFE